MQTILVPLDGSTQAEQVLPYVQQVALALHAQAVLLQVIVHAEHEHIFAMPSEREAATDTSSPSPWMREQQHHWLRQRHRIEAYLETHAAVLRASGVNASCEVRLGPPVATILAVAELSRATLIAVASHGYRGLRRWAAGSIAEQIVQATTTPVLLVRIAEHPPAPASLRRILIPLDGSVFARYALDHAIALAHGARSELVVLQAVASSIEEYIGASAPLLDQRNALRENVRKAYVARYGEQVDAHASITTTIGLGATADAIMEEVHRRHIDLIVLAMPAHSALRRRSRGGTAAQIFHNTHVPLLLVHSPVQHT
jgi:nucleotide-binding universal stress UspA family protein